MLVGRLLIAVYAGNDSISDGGLQIDGQQEGISHRADPVAHARLVGVAQLGIGKLVTAEQLDQRDVARRIEADQDGVVRLPVGHAALHRLAAGQSDVEIGQGVTVRRNHHARPAPLAARHKNGEHAVLGLVDNGDSLGLGVEQRRRRLSEDVPDTAKQHGNKENASYDRQFSTVCHCLEQAVPEPQATYCTASAKQWHTATQSVTNGAFPRRAWERVAILRQSFHFT